LRQTDDQVMHARTLCCGDDGLRWRIRMKSRDVFRDISGQ